MNAELHAKLVDIDWQPAPRKLRQFAVCFAILLLLVGWYGSLSSAVMAVAVAAASSILIASWLRPNALRPVYVAITLVTFPLGLVVGEIALLVIYFGVFWPIGLLFRLMKRDALHRQFDREQVSYWEDGEGERPKGSYLRRY